MSKREKARFAEEFMASTGFTYPPDVNILEVKRTIAVRTAEGLVFLWGVKKEKDGFNVFPETGFEEDRSARDR